MTATRDGVCMCIETPLKGGELGVGGPKGPPGALPTRAHISPPVGTPSAIPHPQWLNSQPIGQLTTQGPGWRPPNAGKSRGFGEPNRPISRVVILALISDPCSAVHRVLPTNRVGAQAPRSAATGPAMAADLVSKPPDTVRGPHPSYACAPSVGVWLM